MKDLSGMGGFASFGEIYLRAVVSAGCVEIHPRSTSSLRSGRFVCVPLSLHLLRMTRVGGQRSDDSGWMTAVGRLEEDEIEQNKSHIT